jgi:hypothetical protein
MRQRTMSKQFESQIEAVVSPLLQQRHVSCYLDALLSITIRRRWKLRRHEMPGVTTAVSCKASHGTVASDWIVFSTTCTIWRSLSQLYLLETKLQLHLKIERCENIFNLMSLNEHVWLSYTGKTKYLFCFGSSLNVLEMIKISRSIRPKNYKYLLSTYS